MSDETRGSEGPRTWTLKEHDDRIVVYGAVLRDAEVVPVVEADAVRELLIRVEKEVDPRSMLNVEVEEMIALLTAHGRLREGTE